ncbi:MAG: SRPBCC family protein [Myxococcota bacterium]|nr:SRPBCC family protein [Myxococcota bacterium]
MRALEARYYRDPALFAAQADRIFAPSWQVLDPHLTRPDKQLRPFTLLPGMLDEPLLRTPWALLSNVCTHRAALLVDRECEHRLIRCPYHGRRFSLAGRCEAAPGFEDVEGFPSAAEHLPELPLMELGPLHFTSLSPRRSFAELKAGLQPWIGDLLDRPGLQLLREDDHPIAANWALYVENYLEGLHLPFVHPGLSGGLNLPAYRHEILPVGTLQIGIAKDGEDTLVLSPDHPLHGQPVRALWFWLWPNTMLNVYPWGLSINRVEPRGVDESVVRYHTWVFNPFGSRRDVSLVSTTESEDQQIVRRVQAGICSRLYRPGRLSPAHEAGVAELGRRLREALKGA